MVGFFFFSFLIFEIFPFFFFANRNDTGHPNINSRKQQTNSTEFCSHFCGMKFVRRNQFGWSRTHIYQFEFVVVVFLLFLPTFTLIFGTFFSSHTQKNAHLTLLTHIPPLKRISQPLNKNIVE